ncbi:protein C3orf33-like [Asterias amurensis]|uniref:protein C3orf33-like n=1 Tax=Asterias amurensis TaxID=7602 RepID=UPI003AB6EEB4
MTVSADIERLPVSRGNALQKFTDFMDDNIQLFRTSITVTAVVGVMLVARSVRVFQRFQKVTDIPDEFIQKNMKLFGHFVKVQQNPVHLIVEHKPILDFRLLSRWQRKQNDTCKGLPIHLAGVQLQNGSAEFLEEKLTKNPSLRFHMLYVDHFNNLQCIIELTRWKFPWRSGSLNEELLRQGLAKVTPLSGVQNQTVRTRLVQKFLVAEIQAQKRARGLWMEERSMARKEALKVASNRVKEGLGMGWSALIRMFSYPGRVGRWMKEVVRGVGKKKR